MMNIRDKPKEIAGVKYQCESQVLNISVNIKIAYVLKANCAQSCSLKATGIFVILLHLKVTVQKFQTSTS